MSDQDDLIQRIEVQLEQVKEPEVLALLIDAKAEIERLRGLLGAARAGASFRDVRETIALRPVNPWSNR